QIKYLGYCTSSYSSKFGISSSCVFSCNPTLLIRSSPQRKIHIFICDVVSSSCTITCCINVRYVGSHIFIYSDRIAVSYYYTSISSYFRIWCNSSPNNYKFAVYFTFCICLYTNNLSISSLDFLYTFAKYNVYTVIF